MKKILKHGGVRVDLIRVLKTECPDCGCKFKFTEDEFVKLPALQRSCVSCPECNSTIMKLCFELVGFKKIKTRVSVKEMKEMRENTDEI